MATITLSTQLLNTYSKHHAIRVQDESYYREFIEHIHHDLFNSVNKSIYVSSFDEYLRLISFVFSRNNNPLHVDLNDHELEQLEGIFNSYGLEQSKSKSKLYSLFLCSSLFSSGKHRIKIDDFISYFLSDNKYDYRYQLIITKDIYQLYTDICKKKFNLSLTILILAAHYYYECIAPNELFLTETKSVKVTNKSTGWRNAYIRGSLDFKNHLFKIKQKTGKSINCIVNNATYQFLLNMKECRI